MEGSVKDRLPPAFWGESALASIAILLALFTIHWPDWIERAFAFDPDHHSGSVEWGLILVLVAVAILFAALARGEWSTASHALSVENRLRGDR
jgi:Flp pilus assembly pilin Flp